MRTITHFIFLTAIRDRLFPAIIVLILLLTGITLALSETAMIEEHAMHVAMSAGLARIILSIGVALFVCFHIRAMYDTKEIDVMLSRPVSRPKLVLGLWFGFAGVSFLLVLALSILLLVLGTHDIASLGLWSLSMLLESCVVVAIALFASLTNKSAVTSVLITFTFYTLGRLMALFVATAKARSVFKDALLNDVISYVIEGVSIIFPRLDLFAQSDWLVYGVSNATDLAYVMAQAAIFIPFILAIAVIDFAKKQF